MHSGRRWTGRGRDAGILSSSSESGAGLGRRARRWMAVTPIAMRSLDSCNILIIADRGGTLLKPRAFRVRRRGRCRAEQSERLAEVAFVRLLEAAGAVALERGLEQRAPPGLVEGAEAGQVPAAGREGRLVLRQVRGPQPGALPSSA